MKRIILYIAVTGALLSFAFGQAQQESTDSKSEQEVKQMIEKYRAAFLRHDIPTLEKIWADDYVFVCIWGSTDQGATSRESEIRCDHAGIDQRRRKAYSARLPKQRCCHEPSGAQGSIQWSTSQRPISEYPRLGKRSQRMAISR